MTDQTPQTDALVAAFDAVAKVIEPFAIRGLDGPWNELRAAIIEAQARAEALDVEAIAHKAAQIGFTYGALGRDFEYVYKNVNDMLAEARAILAGEKP